MSKIVKKKYYALEVELMSPLKVSGGAEYTDSDVMRNGLGELFVPGTSLAGAFRNYLGADKNSDCMYGFSKQDDGKMSSIFISDLYLSGKVDLRDGVALSEEKTVENKFDMQIIETGATGVIYFYYLLREGDKPVDTEIDDLLQAITDGTVRIGSNKNRGFGRIKIHNVYTKEFDFEHTSVEEFLSFQDDFKNIENYEKQSYEDWAKGKTAPEEKYLTIKVPLRLEGGISIRRYSTQNGEADFEQITCNDTPVIPGSSWAGAIRAKFIKVLKEIGLSQEEIQKIVGEWFGSVLLKKETSAKQSKVIFSESIIKDACRKQISRNKIDRFTAAAVTEGLYTEVCYFGGTTELEMKISKDIKENAFVWSLFKALLEDLQNGYISIGGESSIGRGTFEANGEITGI